MEMFCTYCGMPQGERLSCCGENHWMTAREFRDYHGEWPDDGHEDEEDDDQPRQKWEDCPQ